MVDTPGLLDRPMAERNQIEMQAIAALENVGDIVLFLIDPSESSEMSLEDQQHLLSEVQNLLAERPLLVVYSKSDLHQEMKSDVLRISSITGDGIHELRPLLIESIAADEVTDPFALPETWHREVEEIEPVGSPDEIEARREAAMRNAPKPRRGRKSSD